MKLLLHLSASLTTRHSPGMFPFLSYTLCGNPTTMYKQFHTNKQLELKIITLKSQSTIITPTASPQASWLAYSANLNWDRAESASTDRSNVYKNDFLVVDYMFTYKK